MIERFQGPDRRSLLIDSLMSHKVVAGDRSLAEEIAAKGELLEVNKEETFIEQDSDTNDIFLIVAGSCDVIVNARNIAVRGPGDHVGEMAAIQPTQRRSATVTAKETSVLLKLDERTVSDLGHKFPSIYKAFAQELARRLLERNRRIGPYRDKIKVFVICSVEALPVARVIVNSFEYDNLNVEIWNQGCFKVASYTIQDLEAAVDDSDFAIAIAHADDITHSREAEWPAPRDNVIFELGLFMGRLGRARAILMEPREENVKLPSDLAGITTISYRFSQTENNQSLMSPACNRLRDHIFALGPYNG